MITAISTLDRLTDEDHKDYDYFFRLCPLNSVYVEDMLKYLQGLQGADRQRDQEGRHLHR